MKKNLKGVLVELVDTHTHLDSTVFDEDRDAVIQRAKDAGVTRIISIGAGDGFGSAERTVALAERYANVWCAVGIHPNDASTPFDQEKLSRLAHHPRVVALGETGLDFYRERASESDQVRWFKAHIEVARAVKKPLSIHARNAAEECLKLLEQNGASDVGGVFHCFSEDAVFASRLRAINFLVSFPGTLTFKNAHTVRDAAQAIPLEQIMLETDAPYLAPEPHRGKRCESSFTLETARVLAKTKNLSLEAVARQTTQNAVRLFKLIPNPQNG